MNSNVSSSMAAVYAARFCVILLLACASVYAQVTATISGTVNDSSGAILSGAMVVVKNTGTGITQSTSTDAQGRYSVPELPIGDYEVQASASGFQNVVRTGITLTVGAQSVVDFALPVGQSQQTVTVEAQVSGVDTVSTSVGTLIEPTQM